MSKVALPTIGAIPTTYQGVRFRSRLEARWAVFFDARGWAWEHEPEGYGDGTTNYLPDFWLPEDGVFWEVKRDVFTLNEEEIDKALTKAMMLMDLTGKGCSLSFGFPSGRSDDQGRLLILFPDLEEEIIFWKNLGDASQRAARKARGHRFWEPS